jgi:MarR family transcriptional regulator, organic hydroperoxide resistance regulator
MDQNPHREKCKNREAFDCWLQMVRTYDFLQSQVAASVQHHGLTIPQFEVLSTLAVADCTNQQELADRLQVTKGNLVGLIDRLTDRGFVERVVVPDDRRVNRVRITAAGKRLFDQALPEQLAIVDKMMSLLASGELQNLRSLLEKLIRAD